MSFKQANKGKVNPNYKKHIGYRQNCQSCVAVFEARKRGYNIETLPFDKTNNQMYQLGLNPALAYIDKDGNHPKFIDSNVKTPKECEKWLKNQIKYGERYAFGFNSIYGGKHIIIVFKNKLNQLQFYDPQSGIIQGAGLLNKAYYDILVGKLTYKLSPKVFRIDDKTLDYDVLNKISKPY